MIGFWQWLAATDHRRRLPGVDRAVMMLLALGLTVTAGRVDPALPLLVAVLPVSLGASLVADWRDWRDGMWQ